MPSPEELAREKIDQTISNSYFLLCPLPAIQRLYSMLRGEEIDPEIDERSGYELGTVAQASSLWGQRGVPPVVSALLRSEPLPVTYNPAIPIETFDFIITDESHRSIYNLWRH